MTVYTSHRITADGGGVINKNTIDWQAFYPKALRVLCSYHVATFGRETAEDLAQEAILKFWRRLEAGAEFVNDRALWAYLNACVTSVRTDYRRHAAAKLHGQAHLGAFSVEYPPSFLAVTDAYVNDGSDAPIRSIIAALPEDQQLAAALMERGCKPADLMELRPDAWPTIEDVRNVVRGVRGRIARSPYCRTHHQEIAA